MSNDIQPVLNKAPYAPREGVFIPRKQVQKMRRAQDIVAEARQRARAILKDAQRQAADLRRQARAAGYRDGALAAASQVLSHFDASQALERRLRDELEQHARTLLGAALDHPDTVLALLDQCLQGLSGPPRQRMTICLPAAMRGVRARLHALLDAAGHGAADIEYRDDARLVILCGEQVFEFDQQASIEEGSARLLDRFSDLGDAGRKLRDAAMQRWREVFETAGADAEGKESDEDEERIDDEDAVDDDGDGDGETDESEPDMHYERQE